MNNKKIVSTLLLLIVVIVASYWGGFHAPELLAASPRGREWLTSFQMLPETLDTRGVSGDANGKLPPVETYWQVLNKIENESLATPPNSTELTYTGIRGMLKALNDPYTRFLDPKEFRDMQDENRGEFYGIGAQLAEKNGQVMIMSPMPNSPAIRAGIKAGDVVVKVDGTSTKGMNIDQVVKRIRGNRGTKVVLGIQRKGVTGIKSFTMVRDKVAFPNVESKMIDEKAKVGYISLRQFNEQSDEQLDAALTQLDRKGMKALIFDLRGNPGGLLNQAVDIASRFVSSGPAVIIEERGGERNPLMIESDKQNHRRTPLVVLVNKGSASASEIVSGAIKDNKAGILVGTTTFGKGLVQTIIPLADGSAVSITTARYLTPKGIDINKKGIEPDVTVQLTEDEFKKNKDTQLNRAIAILKEKLDSGSKAAKL